MLGKLKQTRRACEKKTIARRSIPSCCHDAAVDDLSKLLRAKEHARMHCTSSRSERQCCCGVTRGRASMAALFDLLRQQLLSRPEGIFCGAGHPHLWISAYAVLTNRVRPHAAPSVPTDPLFALPFLSFLSLSPSSLHVLGGAEADDDRGCSYCSKQQNKRHVRRNKGRVDLRIDSPNRRPAGLFLSLPASSDLRRLRGEEGEAQVLCKLTLTRKFQNQTRRQTVTCQECPACR